MKLQMKETVGRSWLVNTHEVLALQAIARQEGLLAFSALPDAPVMPEPGPGRVRRMLRWSVWHIGQPVQREELGIRALRRPPTATLTRTQG